MAFKDAAKVRQKRTLAVAMGTEFRCEPVASGGRGDNDHLREGVQGACEMVVG